MRRPHGAARPVQSLSLWATQARAGFRRAVRAAQGGIALARTRQRAKPGSWCRPSSP